MKPGGGGRFQKFVKNAEAHGQSPDAAKAEAAAAGRKKFGAAKMADFASKGRARAARAKKG